MILREDDDGYKTSKKTEGPSENVTSSPKQWNISFLDVQSCLKGSSKATSHDAQWRTEMGSSTFLLA